MTEPPSIVLVGPVPPPTGGIATHVAALSTDLQSLGMRVSVAHPGVGTLSPVADLLGRGHGWAMLEAIFRDGRGGVVHGHSALTSYPNMPLLRAFVHTVRMAKATWIETLHSGSLPERYERWPEATRREYARLLRHAEHIIAVGDDLAVFARSLGIRPSAVSALGPLLPSMTAPRDLDVQLVAPFLDRHSPVVLVVGAMEPLHDYTTVLAAFESLRVSHSTAGLVLANSTPLVDPSLERVVRQRCAALGGAVLVLDDIEHSKLLAWMDRADVVVRGHRLESYGLSRVEALMMGTPVVGTRVGEQRFVLAYDHGDVDSVLRAIRIALDSQVDAAEARRYFTGLAKANLQGIVALYRSAGIG